LERKRAIPWEKRLLLSMLSPSRTPLIVIPVSSRALASRVSAILSSVAFFFKKGFGAIVYALTAKEGQLSLEELDDFRYNGAPMAYSLKTGRTMESSDVAKLVQWKM
jgi:hypothetical protein